MRNEQAMRGKGGRVVALLASQDRWCACQSPRDRWLFARSLTAAMLLQIAALGAIEWSLQLAAPPPAPPVVVSIIAEPEPAPAPQPQADAAPPPAPATSPAEPAPPVAAAPAAPVAPPPVAAPAAMAARPVPAPPRPLRPPPVHKPLNLATPPAPPGPADPNVASQAPVAPAPVPAVSNPTEIHSADIMAVFGSRIRAAVQAALRYPRAARMMNLTGRARIQFEYRSGTVHGIHLTQSAGNALLDDAALSAVREASYPQAPPEIGDRPLLLRVWVELIAS